MVRPPFSVPFVTWRPDCVHSFIPTSSFGGNTPFPVLAFTRRIPLRTYNKCIDIFLTFSACSLCWCASDGFRLRRRLGTCFRPYNVPEPWTGTHPLLHPSAHCQFAILPARLERLTLIPVGYSLLSSKSAARQLASISIDSSSARCHVVCIHFQSQIDENGKGLQIYILKKGSAGPDRLSRMASNCLLSFAQVSKGASTPTPEGYQVAHLSVRWFEMPERLYTCCLRGQ